MPSRTPTGRRLRFAAAGAIALMVTVSAPLGAFASTLLQISSDPYTNSTSAHKTQVEPDTFSFGSTIVAATQSGRFYDGGSSNIGWATSTDSGATWTHGFLPGTTVYATPAGTYDRISDPSVAYDPKHNVWLVTGLAIIGTTGAAVLANRSTDGGSTWSNPVTVHKGGGGDFLDKDWVVCDTHSSSPHYGNCYVEFDNANQGDLVYMSTSTDGGLTWSTPKTTADSTHGLGGQPVVQPNGTVIVPFAGNAVAAFHSSDGGATWSTTTTVAPFDDHSVAGGLRTSALPSAEIDGNGRVFVAWQSCHFESGCSANDIVYSTSINGVTWSKVHRVPADPVGSGVDHFIPGIAVDPATKGSGTHIGVTYYYYPVSNCTASTCQLDAGFVSSTDGGRTWSAKTQIAGPMKLSWLAPTNQGVMVGDYISTSWVNGKAFPAVEVANAKLGNVYDESLNTVQGGLAPGADVIPAADDAVLSTGSDHALPARWTAY